MHKNGHQNGNTRLDVGVEENPYYPLRRREERTEPETLTQKTSAANADDKADGPAVEVKPRSHRQRRLAIATIAASGADINSNRGIASTSTASRTPTPPGANSARYPAR